MPGTIQVSVLEFMGLPSSSPSSSISIKVSMGKREYQTRDKGDFSFPLTTLRETLVVTLQDDEGKEISHTDVGIMSIVERGVWDDTFPLEGGGHVHMKLQFILSDIDRNRIRSMRESALKKKKEEVFNSSVRYQESTCNDDSNAALSPRHNDEVSGVTSSQESRKRSIHIEAESSGIGKRSIHSEAVSGGEADTQAGSQSNPNTCYEDSKPSTESQEGTSLYEQKNPNDTDRSKVSSSKIPISQKVELQKELLGNSESSITPPFLQETSTTLGNSETFAATKSSSVSVKLEGESAVKPEKQGPLEKTPSNVRKMVSAFESSLAQDTKPRVKGPTVKPQPNRVVMEGLVKDQNVKTEGDREKLSSDKLKSPVTKPDESVGFGRDLGGTDSPKQTKHLKESSTVEIQSKERNSSKRGKFELLHEENREEQRQAQENLTLTSDIETATVSGRRFDEHSSRDQSSDLSSALEDRGYTSTESGRKISSHEINSWGDSNDKLKPEAYCEVGDYSLENSGVWIFPDERKRFCITTGGKEVMDLMGGCHVEAKTHQIEKNVPITENVRKQDLHSGADDEIKKGEKTSPKRRKSTLKSPEAGASTGPVGQAIKIAIMVGFGALVLFTRQRKSRKSNTEEKNPFLEITEFIDELQPSEEWMDSRQTMMDRLKLS